MKSWRWPAILPMLLAAGCATKQPVQYPPLPLDCLVSIPRAKVEVDMVVDGVRTVLSDDFERYYPDRAVHVGQSGSVLIDCSGRTGSEPCRVVSVDPPDAGFDQAAVRLSRLLRSTQREIRIEFRFLKPPDPDFKPNFCSSGTQR